VEEKTRLLNESTERTGDGTSLVTGYSIGSGLSSSAQHNQRLQVQAELCRRRPSVESGIASIGDRCNYEEASTKAMSGSQYCYDDKSVHTVCSAAEAASYCEEVASTKALAGSVLDSKSLFDSASLRTDSRVVHTRDLSPAIVEGHTEEYRLASLVEDADFSQRAGPSHESLSIGQRGRRGRALSNGSGQSIATPNVIGHSIGDEGHEDVLLMSEEVAMQTIEVFNSRKHRPDSRVDPLHLRTLIDAMREMVSDDHPSSSSTSASQHRMKRTGSNNSLNTPHVSNAGRPVVNNVKTSRDSSGVSVRYENSDSVATETAPISTSRRFFQRFRYRGRR